MANLESFSFIYPNNWFFRVELWSKRNGLINLEIYGEETLARKEGCCSTRVGVKLCWTKSETENLKRIYPAKYSYIFKKKILNTKLLNFLKKTKFTRHYIHLPHANIIDKTFNIILELLFFFSNIYNIHTYMRI